MGGLSSADRNILVTGGAGYIGSHVAKALHREGYRPIVYDNLSHGHEWAVRWGPLEVGDLHDRDRLCAVLERYRPAAAIHLAAFIAVGESVAEPFRYYWNNVAGTLSLLDCLTRAEVPHLVFSSTAAVYGTPERLPLDESHPARPVNTYGRGKWFVEGILGDFERAHGLRSVSLRYFNAAGADPDGEIGEAHDPETHLIPIVLDVALGRRPVIRIFGDDYETRDGTCIRDYIHVSDLATAHLLALRHLEAGGTSDAFNLGNGEGFSVREVIQTAERVTGKSIPTTIAPRREGDPPVLVADASRAKAVLGWRPIYPDLNAQIAHAWAWHRKRGQGS